MGANLDGKSYVRDTGFAHEDWNFKKDLCTDGFAYGYMYYLPKNAAGEFNILFATYDRGEGWALVGYYNRATFNPNGASFPPAILTRRASELHAVAPLGGDYVNSSRTQIAVLLKRETENYRWRVRPQDAHLLQSPLRLPSDVADVRGHYFARPTELSEQEYSALVDYARRYRDRQPMDDYAKGGEVEFPEGKQEQVAHYRRERSAQLVARAKRRFKEQHGRLFCEACEFDFHATYGAVGEDFIEVHHLKPVSEMQDGETTRLEDVALVCSNCHRVLHRRRPWMTVGALKKLLKEPV